MAPKSLQGRLGRSPEPTLALLGDSWGAAGDSWSALGLSGTALGAVLERSWGALGHSGALLNASGRSLGVFGLILALPRSIWELDFEPDTIKIGSI